MDSIRRMNAITKICAASAIGLVVASTPATASDMDAATPESQYGYGGGVGTTVINGTEAHVSDYPYVILGTREGGPRPQGASCTGSVVAPRKVLIAAHCKFASGEKRFLYGLDDFGDPTNGTWLEVVEYKEHPNFQAPNGWQTGWDVAVVTLDRDVPVPAGYKYPRVAGSADSALTEVGRITHFVGYGRVEVDENYSSSLYQTDLPIVAGSGCQSFLPSYNPDYMFCTGYQDGRTGICQGDSGGGTFVDGVIVGVASFVRTGCNSYSGFARLTNAMGDWVNEQLGGTPPDPQNPVASFTFDCSGLSCAFDGSGSSDPDGTISEYRWDFGDGRTGTGVRPSHTYDKAGTYSVILTVIDNDGNKADVTKQVTAGETPPGQAPTADFFAFCHLTACQFDGQFSSDPDGTITSYAWDFGDGTSGSGIRVDKSYPASAGSFNVRLTVTDDSGLTDTRSRLITCQVVGSFTFCFG